MKEIQVPDLRQPSVKLQMFVQCRPNGCDPICDFIGEKNTMRPISPTFNDLVPLYDWMHENGWVSEGLAGGVRRAKDAAEFYYFAAKKGDVATIKLEDIKRTGVITHIERPSDRLIVDGRFIANKTNILKLQRE